MSNILWDQKTPREINRGIALRIRAIRKQLKMTQQTLCIRSGVSLGSIKRFERTGEISLGFLVKIAIALQCEDELDNLFMERPFRSIQEIIDGQH